MGHRPSCVPVVPNRPPARTSTREERCRVLHEGATRYASATYRRRRSLTRSMSSTQDRFASLALDMFADDIPRPDGVEAWGEQAIVEYLESGGTVYPYPMAETAAAPEPTQLSGPSLEASPVVEPERLIWTSPDDGWRRALERADQFGAAVAGNVWNFAYGSNLSPSKVRSRGLKPVKTLRGKLPGWSLLFNHQVPPPCKTRRLWMHRAHFCVVASCPAQGGFGDIERVSKIHRDRYSVGPLAPVPEVVHGAMILLTRADFARLAWQEWCYDTVEVPVKLYAEDCAGQIGRIQSAMAFKTIDSALVSANTLPSARYIGIIREGARTVGIESAYLSWLERIPSC
eukprot:1467399-Prymnesium_polylepis.1